MNDVNPTTPQKSPLVLLGMDAKNDTTQIAVNIFKVNSSIYHSTFLTIENYTD